MAYWLRIFSSHEIILSQFSWAHHNKNNPITLNNTLSKMTDKLELLLLSLISQLFDLELYSVIDSLESLLTHHIWEQRQLNQSSFWKECWIQAHET